MDNHHETVGLVAGDNTDATPPWTWRSRLALCASCSTVPQGGAASIAGWTLTGEKPGRSKSGIRQGRALRPEGHYYVSRGASAAGAIHPQQTEEGSALIANKATGAQAWKLPLPAAPSPPLAVYTADGRARVIQADAEGRLYLIDGASGQVLFTLELGGPVDGSPAVYNDVLVIGTSGRNNSRMYGIRLE